MLMMALLGDIIAGRKLPRPLRTGFTSHIATWVITVLAASLGLWGSLRAVEIYEALAVFAGRLAGDAQSVELAWETVTFVALAVFVWPGTLYLRLVAVQLEERRRVRRIEGAIHRAPNRGVIDNYPYNFTEAVTVCDALRADGHLSHSGDIEALESGVRLILSFVASLVREFSHYPNDVNYTANLMLLAEPGSLSHAQLDVLRKGLHFADRKLEDYSYVLWLPTTMAVTADGDAVEVPNLSLPVPDKARTARGHNLALPGAPWALLTGQQSVYEDTRRLHHEWTDQRGDVRSALEEFFSDEGEGRTVRSFASYRIRREDKDVGVLNIDSDCPNVLGPDPEFYGTFFAMVTPYLHLLAEPLYWIGAGVVASTDLFRSGELSLDLKGQTGVS